MVAVAVVVVLKVMALVMAVVVVVPVVISRMFQGKTLVVALAHSLNYF